VFDFPHSFKEIFLPMHFRCHVYPSKKCDDG
jgi:hypothetical protein